MNYQTLTKSASIISRGSNRFFDHALAMYGIGCGQQFFLAQIADREGISMYDLARRGSFDKATVTRAIQKLGEMGYITCEMDESDHRVRHLHTTEAAGPLLDYLQKLRCDWETVLTEGMTPEEIASAGTLLEKIAQNASRYQKEGGI